MTGLHHSYANCCLSLQVSSLADTHSSRQPCWYCYKSWASITVLILCNGNRYSPRLCCINISSIFLPTGISRIRCRRDFTDPQAQPSVRKKFTHSIFQPTSARTNSPYDDDFDDSYDNDYVSSKQRNIAEVENKPANHSHSGFVSEKNLDSFLFDAANFSTSANMDKKRNNVGSSRPDSSTKSEKDGIANNMTLQGLQTGNKASLLSLENSYRNIKPKTPVNQVRQKSRSKLLPKSGTVIAEDYIKTCNMAAAIIQRWYRRHSKFNAKAELKRLLGEKQEKILAERNSEIRKEEEKRRTKEEKAKVARQQAIQVQLYLISSFNSFIVDKKLTQYVVW